MTAPRLDMRLASELPEIHRLAEAIEAFCETNGISAKVAHHFNLALDEILTNIISYAFEPNGLKEIDVTLEFDKGSLSGGVTDSGRPFDPLGIPAPDLGADLSDRPIGGLGVHFVKTLMDQVEYRRADDRNHLAFSKKLAPTG